MKKYRTLLFDVDDTLLDFGAAEHSALCSLCRDHGISFTPNLHKTYKTINQRLWKAFENGEISKEELLHTRFSLFLNEIGHEADGTELEKTYRGYLAEGSFLIEGALELIKSLSTSFRLYIVTNGVSHTQNQRLQRSELASLFDGVFVSEDTGYQKPMKEYFDYVFERIPQFSREQTLIIGDSLNADIKGGEMAGLDTCWFNPTQKINGSEIIPTYEIQSLNQLYEIVKFPLPAVNL